MRFNEIGGISYQLCFGCNPFAKNIGTLKRLYVIIKQHVQYNMFLVYLLIIISILSFTLSRSLLPLPYFYLKTLETTTKEGEE